jgi:hypothetical protein
MGCGLSSNSSAADLGVKVTKEYFLQDFSEEGSEGRSGN